MNFGSGAGGGVGAGGASAAGGPDLEQIDTEQLAFRAASGEDKLRLLPSSWPADRLPPPTSSLLSIAPGKGLVAAAGPESLILASTQNVRSTFIKATADANKVKSTTPEVTLPIPRVSQVTFSSDESCLVITAEQGGGLAVYDVDALLSHAQQPAFQLATEGQNVRQLLPNPNPAQDLSRYFGVVTENGQLLLADLKEQKLVPGSGGSVVFHENVTCACWSRLGKQIVAGLTNGTAVQIDPQGIVKAAIPEPPQLPAWKQASAAAHPITSILWLETHDFLVVHTPIHQAGTEGNDDSVYHLARRDKATSSWIFSRFSDPCPPFGMERRPAQHFIQRLREWLDINDLIVLSSTASTDIGMFTRSKSPLDPQHPVVNAFTWTQPPDDRRAAMPMSSEGDTSPIGMAIDLSVQEKVPRPIPTDETLEESPVPMPALYVLNNEGLLSMWYIIYNESVRQAMPYPDLTVAGGPRPLGEQKAPPPASQNTSSPVSFAGRGQPASTFGQASAPAFGGSSTLGQSQSPWAAAATSSGSTPFKQPAFGSSTFGQTGGMGMNKGSVWGTPQQSQPQQVSSGAGVFGGKAAQSSPFLNLGNQAGSQSGFASLAKNTESPFAAAGKSNAFSGFSAFGSGTLGNEKQASAFGANASKPSLSAEPSGSTISFGNGTSFDSSSTNFGVSSFKSSPTPTPQPAQSREESMADSADEASGNPTLKAPAPSGTTAGPGLFGLGSSGFKLGTTFQTDGSAKDDLPKPRDAGAGLFGKGFGEALGLGGSGTGKDEHNTNDSRSGSEAAWLSGKSAPAVKKEPGTEEPSLQDIPPARPQSEEAAKPAALDDAPLPPDPTTWKAKPGALPPPVPPGFEADFASPGTEQEPKVKDATAQGGAASTPAVKDTGKPLAGSPPVDVGDENFSEDQPPPVDSEDAGPPESDEDGDQWSDEEGEELDEEDEEDDAVNDEYEEDEENRTPQIVDAKGLSAFEARLTPASPKRGEQQKHVETESTTPATDKKHSYTPAGMPKAPIMFPPPQRAQTSPRSPSPQRSATSPLRSMPLTFGSSQGQAVPLPSQLPPPSQPRTGSLLEGAAGGQSNGTPFQPIPAQKQEPARRIAVAPAQLARPEREVLSQEAAAPEEGELEDEEDARIQAELAAPIERTKEVPSFLAHQDYVADGREKEGLGGQIERVFRDINSMVDTLALNARSLRGFVEGNNESSASATRSRLDLEEGDDWALCEAASLVTLLDGIEVQLTEGRVEDARAEIESLRGEEKEINRLRSRMAETRKHIAVRSDPDHLVQQHAAALPMETQVQQLEIRQGVQAVQRLLANAEEKLSVLRAELASLPSTAGADGNRKMPTVEAVTKTVLKMTAMIEKKSGDVDLLESQIKKLGGPAALGLRAGYEDALAASMKASRISAGSPAALRSSRLSMHGSPAASRMRASRSTPEQGNRKSLFVVSDVEVEAYRAKKDARRKAMECLREELEARGPRVVKVRP